MGGLTIADSNGECLINDLLCFPDVELAFKTGINYSNTTGGGVQGENNSITFFETDETSFLWNAGFGFYDQRVNKPEEKFVLTFDANVGYGKAYSLDDEAAMGRKETNLKKYLGINLHVPIPLR